MIQRDATTTASADRFLREARLASRLDHPYAAHVYAFGVEPDSTMWIAMELVRGTPLYELISKHGRLALPRFVPLFERLCEVLNAAHEQNIVHRDIKPANVTGRLLPKLLDLGIARGTLKQDAVPSDEREDHLPVEVPDRLISGQTTSSEVIGRLTHAVLPGARAMGRCVERQRRRRRVQLGRPRYSKRETEEWSCSVGSRA